MNLDMDEFVATSTQRIKQKLNDGRATTESVEEGMAMIAAFGDAFTQIAASVTKLAAQPDEKEDKATAATLKGVTEHSFETGTNIEFSSPHQFIMSQVGVEGKGPELNVLVEAGARLVLDTRCAYNRIVVEDGATLVCDPWHRNTCNVLECEGAIALHVPLHAGHKRSKYPALACAQITKSPSFLAAPGLLRFNLNSIRGTLADVVVSKWDGDKVDHVGLNGAYTTYYWSDVLTYLRTEGVVCRSGVNLTLSDNVSLVVDCKGTFGSIEMDEACTLQINFDSSAGKIRVGNDSTITKPVKNANPYLPEPVLTCDTVFCEEDATLEPGLVKYGVLQCAGMEFDTHNPITKVTLTNMEMSSSEVFDDMMPPSAVDLVLCEATTLVFDAPLPEHVTLNNVEIGRYCTLDVGHDNSKMRTPPIKIACNQLRLEWILAVHAGHSFTCNGIERVGPDVEVFGDGTVDVLGSKVVQESLWPKSVFWHKEGTTGFADVDRMDNLCDKTLYVYTNTRLDTGADVTVDSCVIYRSGSLDVASGSLHVRNKLFLHGNLYSSNGCNVTVGEHVRGLCGVFDSEGEGDNGEGRLIETGRMEDVVDELYVQTVTRPGDKLLQRDCLDLNDFSVTFDTGCAIPVNHLRIRLDQVARVRSGTTLLVRESLTGDGSLVVDNGGKVIALQGVLCAITEGEGEVEDGREVTAVGEVEDAVGTKDVTIDDLAPNLRFLLNATSGVAGVKYTDEVEDAVGTKDDTIDDLAPNLKFLSNAASGVAGVKYTDAAPVWFAPLCPYPATPTKVLTEFAVPFNKTWFVESNVVLDTGSDVCLDNVYVYNVGSLVVKSGRLLVQNKIEYNSWVKALECAENAAVISPVITATRFKRYVGDGKVWTDAGDMNSPGGTERDRACGMLTATEEVDWIKKEKEKGEEEEEEEEALAPRYADFDAKSLLKSVSFDIGGGPSTLTIFDFDHTEYAPCCVLHVRVPTVLDTECDVWLDAVVMHDAPLTVRSGRLLVRDSISGDGFAADFTCETGAATVCREIELMNGGACRSAGGSIDADNIRAASITSAGPITSGSITSAGPITSGSGSGLLSQLQAELDAEDAVKQIEQEQTEQAEPDETDLLSRVTATNLKLYDALLSKEAEPGTEQEDEQEGEPAVVMFMQEKDITKLDPSEYGKDVHWSIAATVSLTLGQDTVVDVASITVEAGAALYICSGAVHARDEVKADGVLRVVGTGELLAQSFSGNYLAIGPYSTLSVYTCPCTGVSAAQEDDGEDVVSFPRAARTEVQQVEGRTVVTFFGRDCDLDTSLELQGPNVHWVFKDEVDIRYTDSVVRLGALTIEEGAQLDVLGGYIVVDGPVCSKGRLEIFNDVAVIAESFSGNMQAFDTAVFTTVSKKEEEDAQEEEETQEEEVDVMRSPTGVDCTRPFLSPSKFFKCTNQPYWCSATPWADLEMGKEKEEEETKPTQLNADAPAFVPALQEKKKSWDTPIPFFFNRSSSNTLFVPHSTMSESQLAQCLAEDREHFDSDSEAESMSPRVYKVAPTPASPTPTGYTPVLHPASIQAYEDARSSPAAEQPQEVVAHFRECVEDSKDVHAEMCLAWSEALVRRNQQHVAYRELLRAYQDQLGENAVDLDVAQVTYDALVASREALQILDEKVELLQIMRDEAQNEVFVDEAMLETVQSENAAADTWEREQSGNSDSTPLLLE